VIALNRKQRNKMSVVKEGLEVSEVLIQEGVHSFETLNEAVAEPVIYMIDRYVVGGFYRVHTGRGKDENLNAPGMHFEPLAFETGCNCPTIAVVTRTPPPNRFYAYGVVGRLACLAAAQSSWNAQRRKTTENPGRDPATALRKAPARRQQPVAQNGLHC
jgi:glutamate--cysteine ligase